MNLVIQNAVLEKPWLGFLSIALILMCGRTFATESNVACELPERIRFSMTPAGSGGSTSSPYDQLAKRIESSTGRRVVVVAPNSYSSVIESLLSNNLDVAAIGPASYLEARRGQGEIVPFATIERRTGPFQSQGNHYQSMLVVLADRHFSNIDALRKMRLTLTDPSSTSGALIPTRRFFERFKIPVGEFFQSVGYSGSHGKSIQLLLRGDTDAVFVASNHLEDAVANGMLKAEQVKVLWRSEGIPFDPFVYRGQLCDSLKRQIREAFFGDSSPAELQEILQRFHAARFVPVDDAAYDNLRQVLDH